MFSLKIFTIHSWEYISWKWTCLIEIWITWFQKELAIPQFQIPRMKSQKELWKPDLYLVSQGCQHEKMINFPSRIQTRDPCISYKYFDIGPSMLYMWRSQLREQISQTSKSVRQELQSLVLNGTNIDLWKSLVSCFDDPVTKHLLLMQGSWVRIQGVKINSFSWWHPWEPRLGSKPFFHNSFWDLVVPDRISWMTLEICEWIWERVCG